MSDERFHSGCSSLRSLFVPWEVDRWRSVMAPRLLFPLFPLKLKFRSLSRFCFIKGRDNRGYRGKGIDITHDFLDIVHDAGLFSPRNDAGFLSCLGKVINGRRWRQTMATSLTISRFR